MIRAADMLIARRADTRARADFATWKMMAKLNGITALSGEALTFLESYKALLKQMSEPEATEATINLMYQAYYGEMGGAGEVGGARKVERRNQSLGTLLGSRPPRNRS